MACSTLEDCPGPPPVQQGPPCRALCSNLCPVLQNFWYAAALSQDVKPNKLKEVKMLGRTVVLYRDEEGGCGTWG